MFLKKINTFCFQEAETRASQIDAAVGRMRDFVGNLTSGLEEAIVKVNESQERAQSLSEQAQFLEKCVAKL